MKILNDMSVKAKAIHAIWILMVSVAGAVIWLFSTFTLASAFNEYKDSQDKKELYRMRLHLRQSVADCKYQEERFGPLKGFMLKACTEAEEEYNITVDEIKARWGKK